MSRTPNVRPPSWRYRSARRGTIAAAVFVIAAAGVVAPTPRVAAQPAPSAPAAARPDTSPTPDAGRSPQGADAAGSRSSSILEGLQRRHRDWLEAAAALITREERIAFLKLRRDYQRDAFIDRFWQVRDPYPETARNELRERFDRMVALVEGVYGTYEDDRARILLVHGRPQSGFEVRCTKTRIPAEVWVYDRSSLVDFPFLLVFVKQKLDGPAFVLRPGQEIFYDATIDTAKACINGERFQRALAAIREDGINYQRMLDRVLAKPRPRSEEWLATFVAFSTEVPSGTPELPAELSIEYPGRHKSRTVLQGLVSVPRSAVTIGDFGGYRSADFQLVGEVVSGGRLFENFRYTFGFPEEVLPPPAAGSGAGTGPGITDAMVPLAFQRYLRPGKYTLIVRLEDLHGDGVARLERKLTVPKVDQAIDTGETGDAETAGIFAEATAAIAAGETSLQIVRPPGTIHTGLVRIDTLAVGSDIERVSFFLDDRLVMTKNRPPFNVELDLGEVPKVHVLRAVAYDGEGVDVARDEAQLNAGGNRFLVRLLEPRKGQRYERSLRARAEVDVPQGREVERVEFFVNEQKVATLYQPPWDQPVVLPEDSELTYVRAVAHLADGLVTEDLVFVNAPDSLEELDVQFVELYTSALDRQGRPVEGLEQADFRVFEDGVEQRISRFETVRDLPIHAGILIDNSASMSGSLEAARRAALTFFSQAIGSDDRAALITFNKFPHLAVKLTNNLQTLGGGLAGLVAEGETALYDSLIFGLYYLAGIEGQRALLVLSDGKDEASRFSYGEALEYARRAGVTVYTVGLGLREADARQKLSEIAEETGGRSFFVGNAEELDEIYRSIQQELRSQYLIAYQSSNTSDDHEYREVELRVDEAGVKVQTISGYYP